MKNALELLSHPGPATLVRPIYSPGLLLEDEDLNAGVDYFRDMTRLLFRSLFGCGVICGLKVTAAPICQGRQLQVVVGAGLALDGLGNPVQVPTDQTLVYDPECNGIPTEIWVLACYQEHCCRRRDTVCGEDDESPPVATRSRDGFRLVLAKQKPDCACLCEPPASDGGTASRKAQAAAAADTAATNAAPASAAEAAARCYADHVNGVCPCGCGCDCVVIGRLTLDSGAGTVAGVKVDDSVVRRIRPLLIGQWPWLATAPSQLAPASTPASPPTTPATPN